MQKEQVEFAVRPYSIEEYQSDMKRLIAENGLLGAVKKYCDLIDEEVSGTPYVMHRTVQEYLCNILDLIEINDGMKQEVNNAYTKN